MTSIFNIPYGNKTRPPVFPDSNRQAVLWLLLLLLGCDGRREQNEYVTYPLRQEKTAVEFMAMYPNFAGEVSEEQDGYVHRLTAGVDSRFVVEISYLTSFPDPVDSPGYIVGLHDRVVRVVDEVDRQTAFGGSVSATFTDSLYLDDRQWDALVRRQGDPSFLFPTPIPKAKGPFPAAFDDNHIQSRHTPPTE